VQQEKTDFMSLEELDLNFLQIFNDCQLPADLDMVELLNIDPAYVDSRDAPMSWRDLANEATTLANCTLIQSE
jgi:hypothetical protein